MTHVMVDADPCLGHGRCHSLAPGIYGRNEVGHTIVRIEDLSGELEQPAVAGAQNRPTDAITLTS